MATLKAVLALLAGAQSPVVAPYNRTKGRNLTEPHSSQTDIADRLRTGVSRASVTTPQTFKLSKPRQHSLSDCPIESLC